MTTTIESIMSAAADHSPRRSAASPAVHRAAWHGPLGEAVCRIAPATEADPVAVLAQLLALWGAMCGDGPHVFVGGVRHPARIWPLVIGKTGAGRKGTSWAEARRIARQMGPYAERYLRDRVMAGLSSGEGLLAALGASTAHHGDKAGPIDSPTVNDPQAPDGKLMVTETEFARVLAATKREGNTLGPILRQMWDDGAAQIMTRAAPLKVDGAHLGLAAHVTPRELKLRLDEASLVGGTLNRFLLVYSERPQLLPYEPPHPPLDDLTGWLETALETARTNWGSVVHRDRQAEDLWPEVYRALNATDPDGLLGAVLARGPAYTMRLALAFALADRSSSITYAHLLAGLAVWHYAASSAREVFSDARSRTFEQKLADYLAADPGGRTRAEIYRQVRNDVRADALDNQLDQWERAGFVSRSIDDPTGGRPAQRYRWTGRPRDPILAILDSAT